MHFFTFGRSLTEHFPCCKKALKGPSLPVNNVATTTNYFKMAAYIATHDRSALAKPHGDTKASAIQNSTHKDILTIGNKLYQKLIDDNDKEQRENLTEVEKRIWCLASEDKAQALKEAKDAGEVELEKAMVAAKKAQEKAVKAESKRVEALMKKLAAQQVQQEKDEGQKRLEEALVKAREEFMLEKAEAVQQTREEERMIAADEAKKVSEAEKDKRKQLILAAEKEKQQALNNLKEILKQEQKQVVSETEKNCKKEEEMKVKQLKEAHENEVKELEKRIDHQIKLTEAANEETERTLGLKRKVEEKLKNTVTAFQNFIDTTKGFNKGQADFILQDPLKDELEKGGEMC